LRQSSAKILNLRVIRLVTTGNGTTSKWRRAQAACRSSEAVSQCGSELSSVIGHWFAVLVAMKRNGVFDWLSVVETRNLGSAKTAFVNQLRNSEEKLRKS